MLEAVLLGMGWRRTKLQEGRHVFIGRLGITSIGWTQIRQHAFGLGMYSLGVLLDGHKSGPGRKACVVTFLAAREGLQHVWVHAYMPCLERMPTQKLWITPGCIQAERS